MANQDNGLVGIVRRIQLEEPILITPEVLDLHHALTNLEFRNIMIYDGETRSMETELDADLTRRNEMKLLYARRLLSAILCESFYQKSPGYASPLSCAIASYGRAGNNAKIYERSDPAHDIQWPFRALAVYSRGARLGHKKEGRGIDRDVFFISVKGAHAGLKLLKMERNGLDCSAVIGWNHDRLAAVSSDLLRISNELFSNGISIDNRKILIKYQENLVDAEELGLA